jgi:hypothetical protein
MASKFRFISVNDNHSNFLWKIVIDQAVRLGVNETYQYIKQILNHNQIGHNDEEQHHHRYLSRQGGLFSIYYDPSDNSWKFERHNTFLIKKKFINRSIY